MTGPEQEYTTGAWILCWIGLLTILCILALPFVLLIALLKFIL